MDNLICQALQRQSWNGTDKAWIEMGNKCAVMGITVAGDWAAVQP